MVCDMDAPFDTVHVGPGPGVLKISETGLIKLPTGAVPVAYRKILDDVGPPATVVVVMFVKLLSISAHPLLVPLRPAMAFPGAALAQATKEPAAGKRG